MTPKELDALIARLPGLETPMMKGDNLAILLCNYFENADQEIEDDTGWTPDAHAGYEEVLAAIRAHFQPAIDAIEALRTQLKAVLDREAETIRRYDAKLDGMEADLREARHERDGFHAERDLAREDVARLRKLGDGMAEAKTTLIERALSIFENCAVESSVCCCGDEMGKHSEPMACGHSPVDSGTYTAHQWAEDARTALAAWNLEALR